MSSAFASWPASRSICAVREGDNAAVNATVSRDLDDVCSSAVSRGVQRCPLLPFTRCNLRSRNYPPRTAECCFEGAGCDLLVPRRGLQPSTDCGGVAGRDAVEHGWRLAALDYARRKQPEHCRRVGVCIGGSWGVREEAEYKELGGRISGGGCWTSEGGSDEKSLSQRVAGLVLLQQE